MEGGEGVPTPWIFEYGGAEAASIVVLPAVSRLRDSYLNFRTEKRTGVGVFGRRGGGSLCVFIVEWHFLLMLTKINFVFLGFGVGEVSSAIAADNCLELYPFCAKGADF